MGQQPLPGASTVLTMGILSVVGTVACCGPFGAIFSIIALVKAKTANDLYTAEPEAYSDYSSVKTGKILAYIGIGLSAIYLTILIVYFIIYFGFIVAMVSAGNFHGDY